MSLINQQVAGRYRIDSLIARGGMADVYLATDERLDRQVAVKVIHAHLASDPRFTEKFIREAKTAARLNHPNLVNVFDQGTDNGVTFMVMEYVAGQTLRQALDKYGLLSPARALDLTDAILQGLAAAHRAGILHRDLKPENVFLANDGRIKLGDFGLAREANENTSTGNLLGTIAYIAPELLSRGHADARSDVYSIGIMLFEFLTGSQPFPGSDVAHIAHQHLSVGVPVPSSLNPEIPPLLDELVLWAAARDAAHRPADAAVLGEVLKRVRAEIRAGRGATTHLDLPEFTGVQATSILSTQVLNPGTTATQVIGGDSAATQVLAADAGATQVIDHETISPLHPLEELSERRRRRGKWIALGILGFTPLSSAAGWWFSAGPGGMTALPDLTSTNLTTTEKFLSQYSSDIGVTKEFSATVSVGLVTRTDPPAGALFWRGSHLTVFVSKGPQLEPVPSLKGLGPRAAAEKLQRAGFKAGTSISYFADAPKGTVFDYLGSDGSKIALGSDIPLKVSAGPLPQVVGQQQTAAIAALQAVGLKVDNVVSIYSDAVATGAVVAINDQQPIQAGQNIGLTISLGPTTVVVPNFYGETLAAAQLALKSQGLNPVVSTNQLQANWSVVKVKYMSVAPGTVVKRGTQITISNQK